MIKNIQLTGRNNSSIMKPVSGPVASLLTYLKTGIAPEQGSLDQVLTNNDGSQTVELYLPIWFMDPSNVFAHETDLDTNGWSNLNLEYEFHTTPEKYLYPDYAGPGIKIDDTIEFDISIDHVLDAPANYGRIREFVRSHDIVEVEGAKSGERISLPERTSVKQLIIQQTSEEIGIAPVSIEGVITDYKLLFGDRNFDDKNIAHRRKKEKLFLNEVVTYPEGFIVLESSPYDRLNSHTFDIRADQGNEIQLDFDKLPGKVTGINFFYIALMTREEADEKEVPVS